MKYSLLIICLALVFQTFGCSDISLSNEYSSVSARTMDMDCDLHSKVLIIPRNMKWSSENCGEIKGLSWANKYGFIAVNTLGQETVYCDGMNEKGLSAANLYLKETSYPEPKKGNNVLAVMDMTSWILGNFDSVNELKKALGNIVVWGNIYKPWGIVCKLHFIAHDAYGKSLIIEWIGGKMNLNESNGKFCVLTNDPDYKKQLESAISSAPINNDITNSQQRFKFLYTVLKKYYQANSNCNNFLIPSSEIIARAATIRGEDKESEDKYFSTQFIVLRDHTNKRFYIKFSGEPNYTQIDLNKENFLSSSIENR